MSLTPPQPGGPGDNLRVRLERLELADLAVAPLPSRGVGPGDYPRAGAREALRLVLDGEDGPRVSSLPGQWEALPTPCLVAHLPASLQVGAYRVGALRGLERSLAALFPEQTPGLEEVVFLDTETTGLELGMGTYVYLVGLGSVAPDGSLRVEQLFLRSPAGEAQFLRDLDARLRRFRAVVSFHGAGFDLPHLLARYAGHGQSSVLGALAHCDLALLSKGLWRASFERHRLRDYEQHVLGFRRGDDIEGAACPQAYIDFLTEGARDDLRRVFVHNALDLLSLALLAPRFSARLAAPKSPAEHFGAGRIALARGESERALYLFDKAAQERHGLPAHYRGRSLWRMASELGRWGKSSLARSLLEDLLEVPEFAEAARGALAAGWL